MSNWTVIILINMCDLECGERQILQHESLQDISIDKSYQFIWKIEVEKNRLELLLLNIRKSFLRNSSYFNENLNA